MNIDATTARWLFEHTNLRASIASRGPDAKPVVQHQLRQLVTLARNTGDSASKPLPELLSATQAARYVGVTPEAVRLAIREGRLKGRIIGTQWAVTPDDLHAWATQRRRRSA